MAEPRWKNIQDGNWGTGGRRIVDMRVRGIEGIASNFQASDAACRVATLIAVARFGNAVKRRARQLVPVDTGRTKRSIVVVLSDGGFTVTVGCDVAPFERDKTGYYPPHLEWGYRKKSGGQVAARPFLGPAYQAELPKFKQDIGIALRNAIARRP